MCWKVKLCSEIAEREIRTTPSFCLRMDDAESYVRLLSHGFMKSRWLSGERVTMAQTDNELFGCPVRTW